MRSRPLQRIRDLFGASAMLALAAPLMLGTAAIVYLRMGRPILFRQVRAGYQGRPFTLLKFRTMREAVGPDGKLLPDGERLTRLGRWLRRNSLDELPQLFNVLAGQMSLFGPRPLPVRYVDRYTPQQARRLDVKPGLTGWNQVNGRNALPWEEKFALDVWYVDNRSLWLDVRILLMTIRNLLRPHGVNHAGDATMPEFQGTGKTIEPPAASVPPEGAEGAMYAGTRGARFQRARHVENVSHVQHATVVDSPIPSEPSDLSHRALVPNPGQPVARK